MPEEHSGWIAHLSVQHVPGSGAECGSGYIKSHEGEAGLRNDHTAREIAGAGLGVQGDWWRQWQFKGNIGILRAALAKRFQVLGKTAESRL